MEAGYRGDGKSVSHAGQKCFTAARNVIRHQAGARQHGWICRLAGCQAVSHGGFSRAGGGPRRAGAIQAGPRRSVLTRYVNIIGVSPSVARGAARPAARVLSPGPRDGRSALPFQEAVPALAFPFPRAGHRPGSPSSGACPGPSQVRTAQPACARPRRGGTGTPPGHLLPRRPSGMLPSVPRRPAGGSGSGGCIPVPGSHFHGLATVPAKPPRRAPENCPPPPRILVPGIGSAQNVLHGHATAMLNLGVTGGRSHPRGKPQKPRGRPRSPEDGLRQAPAADRRCQKTARWDGGRHGKAVDGHRTGRAP
jgi:hypothetical protein